MTLQTIHNVVDGVTSDAAASTELIAPATGRPFATAPLSRAAEVDHAFSAARRAARSWRRTTPGERQERLLSLAAALAARSDELAALESLNTGKPLDRVIEDEMPGYFDQLRFFAGAARSLAGVAAGSYTEGFVSALHREPVGVCALITPWNYPLTTALWKWAPAIATGNTVVLKPADATPATMALVAEIAAEHLPPGVLNVVCGDRATGALLSEHPEADLVSVTGSVAAGRAVMRAAAERVAIVSLELGGKAPAIVFDDVPDLTETAEGVAFGAFYNAGQDCAAITRVLVQDSIAEEFVTRLVAAAEATRTGPERDADYGALIGSEHGERVQGFIDRLPAHARVLTGGHSLSGDGWFFAPTVVADVRQTDEIVQEEVFGPVVTVQVFHTEEEALELANGTAYGLTASVWTNDLGRAARFSADLESGVVWINAHTVFAAEMPHGGVGLSGHGAELSTIGMEKYTRVKHVMTHVPTGQGL